MTILHHFPLCTFLPDFNGVDFITVLSYRTVCKEQGTGLATVACTCALKRIIDVPLFVVANVVGPLTPIHYDKGVSTDRNIKIRNRKNKSK